MTPLGDDMPKIVTPTARHDNLIMLTKHYDEHNDEKLVITLLIMGAGLISCHFW